jgi:hypothetical protein
MQESGGSGPGSGGAVQAGQSVARVFPVPRAFSLRAIIIGSLLAIAINLITPYNDYVVENTFVVGSLLPLALMLTVLLFVIVGNGVYRLLAPARAFQSGEMAVVLLMLLTSCSIPSQGLLRSFLPTLTTPFASGQTDPIFWKGFLSARMPEWLYPVESFATGREADSIRYFYGRVPDGVAIPYGAWVGPMLAWSVYLAGLFLMLISLAFLLRVQWAEHERLPFPLAQLQLSLIESPEPGRAMNALFRSRSFWVVSGLVLVVHSLSALHLYDERWPEIARSFDLRRVMSEEPWRYVPDSLRMSPVYFTFIGVTFFIRSRTAFSLWFIFVLTQLYATFRAAAQVSVSESEWNDHHLGSCLAFTAGMLVIGRSFFLRTFAAAVGWGVDRRSLAPGTVAAARGVLIGLAVMFAWLMFIGASWWLAGLSIAFVLLAHVITSRIVAETGIPYVRTTPTVLQALTLMPEILPASAIAPRNLFIGSIFSLNGAFNTRETLLGLSQHGMRLLDGTGAMPRGFVRLATLLGWTLAISLVASTWSSLTCYYSYATPLSPRMNKVVLNQDVLSGHAVSTLVTPMVQHYSGKFPEKAHSPMTQVVSGFGITAVLQAATWRFASWPFLPIGYLMAGTMFMRFTWFSILIGWAAKILLLRTGGPKVLETAKPLFLGMIFGEAMAAAVWMLANLVMAARGADYFPYSALPT